MIALDLIMPFSFVMSNILEIIFLYQAFLPREHASGMFRANCQTATRVCYKIMLSFLFPSNYKITVIIFRVKTPILVII